MRVPGLPGRGRRSPAPTAPAAARPASARRPGCRARPPAPRRPAPPRSGAPGGPSTYFSCRQPGQEPGGRTAPSGHLGRRRRAGRLRPAARAAAPVAAAPQQDPDQRDPPVDQLAVLGADELIPRPAARAAPLPGSRSMTCSSVSRCAYYAGRAPQRPDAAPACARRASPSPVPSSPAAPPRAARARLSLGRCRTAARSAS